MSDFGDAVQAMREGDRVRRSIWKGRWLELEGAVIMLHSEEGEARGWLLEDDESVAIDLLSDDWEGMG